MGRLPGVASALLAVTLAGCELQEVSIAAPPVDVVVVEALVQLGLPNQDFGGGSGDRLSVLLHRTVEGSEGRNEPVPGALVQITGEGGAVYRLRELLDPSSCVSSTPFEGTGTCYLLRSVDLSGLPPLRPGAVLDLEVQLLEGGTIRGRTVVPGEYDFVGPSTGQVCVLPADEPYPLVWTESEGAWAYVAETQIYGLREALEPRGIEVEIDPLFLVGLSISAADTAIAFPAEFGVFDRFDLDRDVALVLQQGLPPGTWAEIVVAAVDRNYVNWVRGGNFNPSGTVRIPSVTGSGTGFFGSATVRWLEVLVNPPPQGGGVYSAPRCPQVTPP